MDRVFTDLRIKTIDEDQRIVEGWATTGAKDRVGDIVDPLGAEFDLPIPFLLDHDHQMAVGEVERAEVTPQGIRFIARIKKIAEPGLAKDLVDKGWSLLRAGLRKSVSIGFRPMPGGAEPMPDGGWRFTQWEWLELSAVSVPCNPEAQVTGLKRAPDRARLVKLTDEDERRAKILSDSTRRIHRRKALGIPAAPVKLNSADVVNATLGASREKRLITAPRTSDRKVRL